MVIALRQYLSVFGILAQQLDTVRKERETIRLNLAAAVHCGLRVGLVVRGFVYSAPWPHLYFLK